jgi:hypothetical protein
MTKPHASVRAMAFATLAMTAAVAAHAQSVVPYTTQGYWGLKIGKPDYSNPCTPGFSCDDSSASVHLYTGGMFNNYLGAELGYLHMGSADRNGGRTRAQGLNVSLVARAPFGPMSVFAKGGATYGQTDVSADVLSGVPTGRERGWGGSYGVGAGYDITTNSTIVLEWERHNFEFAGIGRQPVKATSLGYVYRF